MKRLLACFSLILSFAFFAHAVDSKARKSVDPDQAYKNNCMRCHTATRQYPPRVTKTIMMHMREVANLSPEVTQAIVDYLNGEPSADKKEK
jgi:hypothetical protein